MKLAVNQLAASFLHGLSQVNQCQFRGVGFQRAHALAEEGQSDGDSVQATYKLLAVPHFDADGKALTVQFLVGLDHLWPQPGIFLVDAQLATRLNHAVEVLVDADSIAAFVHQRLHGVADVNLVGKDDKALHGTEPFNACMAKRVIREDAVAVGQQQTVYAQVATNGNTPIVVAPVGVWEPEFIV